MPTEIKRLYRSKDERMLAGICGGLSEYFKIDPVIWRLLFVFATLAGGPGLILYIIMWIVVPEKPTSSEASMTTNQEPEEAETGVVD